MAIATVDNCEWLEAIGKDPGLTTKDLMAAFYYADADETGLTDEQIQKSFDKLLELGYFNPVLVLDGHASFDVRKTIPKSSR